MEDHTQCTICYEQFKCPVTLRCGHTFCKECISTFWDCKQRDGHVLLCPSCNHIFETMPPLNRNVSLSVITEAVAASSPVKTDVSTGAPVHTDPEELCGRHHKPLVIYCRNDSMCVCYECSVNECKGHDQILVEEERKNREGPTHAYFCVCAYIVFETIFIIHVFGWQAGLKRKSEEIKKRQEAVDRRRLELKENMAESKVSLQQTSQWVIAKFSQLMKGLAEQQEVTQRFLEQQQDVTVQRAEKMLAVLEERQKQFAALQEEIKSLCSLPHCQLIKQSRLIEVPHFNDGPADVNTCLQEKLNPVTDVLSRVSKLVCEDLERAVQTLAGQEKEGSQDKRPILAVVPSPASSSSSYPTEREGISAYRCSLTFDPRTANAHLRLSRSNRRAEHLTSGPCPVPTDKSRFDHTWQVLCFQSFKEGQHYWELEVSKPWAYLGVTYPNIPRKEKGKCCMVGMNELSWSLQLVEHQLSAWHAGRKEPVASRLQLNTGQLRIGMLLDYEAGTLTYYQGELRLHAFHCAFTQELFPACWIGEDVTVTLCEP